MIKKDPTGHDLASISQSFEKNKLRKYLVLLIFILSIIQTINSAQAIVNHKNEILGANDYQFEKIRIFWNPVKNEGEEESPKPFILEINETVPTYILNEKELGKYLRGEDFNIYANLTERLENKRSIEEDWTIEYISDEYEIPIKQDENSNEIYVEFTILIDNRQSSTSKEYTFRFEYSPKTLEIFHESTETILTMIIGVLSVFLLVRARQFKEINEPNQARIAKYYGLALFFVFFNYLMWDIERWVNQERNIDLFPNTVIGGETGLSFGYEVIQMLYFILIGICFALLFYPHERYFFPFIKKFKEKTGISKLLNTKKEDTNEETTKIEEPSKDENTISLEKAERIPYFTINVLLASASLPLGYLAPIFDYLFIWWIISIIITFFGFFSVYFKVAKECSGYVRLKAIFVIIGLIFILFMGLLRANMNVILADVLSIVGIFLFYYGSVSKSR